MSYDYNALVSSIASSRRQAAEVATADEKLQHLQDSVDTFSTLSGHCPMTPLLWMQYSKDTADLLLCLSGDEGEEENPEAILSARDTQCQMLELALCEFPGSAILHVYYLHILRLCDKDKSDVALYDKTEAAFVSAFENVGKGSHRNEGVLIAAIYQLAVEFYSRHGKWDQAVGKFIERAQTPMKDVNDALAAQLEEFCAQHSSEISTEQRQTAFGLLDEARRYESKTYNVLISCEDEVDVAMHKEGILPRHQVDLEQLPWDTILRSDDKMCWMGYGGMLSADAFIQYAQTCHRYRVRIRGKKTDLSEEEQQQIQDDEKAVQDLTLCVYERGVADCPTAESLWLSYIRHLEYAVQADTSLFSRLKNVVDRSVRNCPYSLALYQRKLSLHGILADRGVAVLDPDELQKVVQEAIDLKFIPSKEACLELYMTVTRILRRRLLFLMAKAPIAGSASSPKLLAYDEPEPFSPTDRALTFSDIDESTSQELEDLCDDCRDFYETIDTYLKKNHSSWADGRGRVWSERAYMETHFLGPLSLTLGDGMSIDTDASTNHFLEVLKTYDRLIKIHQPTPPDSYMEFIQTFQRGFPTAKPSSLIAKIRQTRFLYQKALKALGRPKNPTESLDPLLQRDFDSGLRNLCHEYLVFERYFGSEKSLAAATTAIQKKLARFSPQATQPSKLPDAAVPANPQAEDSTHMNVDDKPQEHDAVATDVPPPATGKRDLEDPDLECVPPSKKSKTQQEEETKAKNLKVPKVEHKVKVGDMEYPAHPFTVRVLNLASDTEDMDLVDTFRPRCGPIVHAKIIREKHHHGKGKSKGWGLIQFELEESVDKALELSEVLGIREKLVKVDRSHMPAVTLVPPGMHRVNPKGEGKSSKKNQKHREAKAHEHEEQKEDVPAPPTSSEGQEAKVHKPSKSAIGILAFKPRGVQHSQNHRRVKLALPSTEQKDKGS